MSSIFDPGKKARRAAAGMARDARIDNIFSSNDFFGGGSFTDGRFTSNMGQLGGLAGGITEQLGNVFSQQGQGLTDLRAAAGDALGDLGPLQLGQAAQFQAPQQQQFQPGLMGNLFGQAQTHLNILGQSPEQLSAGQLDIARQLAAPEEQRQRVSQQAQQFAQGRMGTTGGGIQQQALAEAQSRADLMRQQQAFQQGQAIQGQAGMALQNVIGQGLGLQGMGNQINAQNFGQALQGSAQNEMLRQGQFGRDLGMGQFGASRALDRFGIAGNIFDAARVDAMTPWQQMGAGLGALGQVQGFGLNQFNTGLNAAIARSNSIQGGANTMAQVAASTPSPVGDLLGGAMNMFSFSPIKFSDKRLKKNIKRIGTIQETLGWYEWDWNDEAEALGIADEPTYGVIAQEVAEVMPHAVHERHGYLAVDYSIIGGR